MSGSDAKRDVDNSARAELVATRSRQDLRDLEAEPLLEDSYDYKIGRQDRS